MSKWIDEQIEVTKEMLSKWATMADAKYLATLQALKKSEEALNSFIHHGYDREVAISTCKAIEELGRERD